MSGQEPENRDSLRETILGDNGFSAIDHSWDSDTFATCGSTVVQTWNPNRKKALHTYNWGEASVHTLRLAALKKSGPLWLLCCPSTPILPRSSLLVPLYSSFSLLHLVSTICGQLTY